MTENSLHPMPWSEPTPAGPCNPDRVGIFMNVLEKIITDLNQSRELQEIFGIPVSRALVLVADNNDLRIEEGGRVPLDASQTETFLRVLYEVVRRNSL